MHPPFPHALDLATLAQAEQPSGWLAGFVARDYPKGYLLASPGDARDQVFVVKSGRLRVYLAGETRELSLSFLEPGDIYTTHTPTYVQTVSPCTLWCIHTADFARRLASPVNCSLALIDDLAFREVPARLARFLLGLVERRGQPQADGWLIPLELGTEDIASLLGSTRQTVSQLLNQWARDGILARPGRRQLLVRSRQALENLSAS